MKKLLLFVVVFGIHFMLSGQEEMFTRYRFVKKNGSMVVGQIVEKKSDGPYRILLDNGVIFELREQDVLRFKPIKEKLSGGERHLYSVPLYRWGFSTEVMGVNNGIRNIGSPGISTGASMTGQRYITPDLSLGVGMGIYNYDLDARRLVMPLYGEIRYRFIRHFTSPVVALKSGYGWTAKNYIGDLQQHRGGAFINPFVGYEFGMDRKISWTLGVGLLFQKAYYAYANGQEEFDEDIYFKRTEFKLGITIH